MLLSQLRCDPIRSGEDFIMPGTLSSHELQLIDAYWRASNYLTIGQIYLKENPLLREDAISVRSRKEVALAFTQRS